MTLRPHRAGPPLLCILLAAAALAGCVGQVTALPPPPAPPAPPPPHAQAARHHPARPRLVWVPGHWGWDKVGYSWIPGRYVRRVASR